MQLCNIITAKMVPRKSNFNVNFCRIELLISVLAFLLRGFNGQWIEPVKCLDYISSSICSGILKVYGEDRCRIDFLFGRYQCCWTCAATLGIPIDSLGRFNDQQGFYFYHPGCPNNVRDAIDALGSSSTQWCMHWKEKNNGMNCYEPLFQYKCYKTCRVKCGAFSD